MNKVIFSYFTVYDEAHDQLTKIFKTQFVQNKWAESLKIPEIKKKYVVSIN